MKRDEHKDKLESFFQRSLHEYGEEPSDGFWEKLEQNIPEKPKRKRRIVAWWKWGSAAAALLLLLLVGFCSYKNDIDTLNEQIANQGTQIEELTKELKKPNQTLSKEDAVSDQAANSAERNDNNASILDIENSTKINSENSSPSSLNQLDESINTAKNNSNSTKPFPNNFQSEISNSRTTKVPVMVQVQSKKEEVKAIDLIEDNSNLIESKLEDVVQIIEEETPTEPGLKEKEVINFFDLFNAIPSTVILAEAGADKKDFAWEAVEPLKNKRKNKWSAIAYFGLQKDLQSIASRSQDDQGLYLSDFPDGAGVNNSYSIAPVTTFSDAWSAGVMADYRLNKNWSVAFGLGSKVHQERFQTVASGSFDPTIIVSTDPNFINFSLNPYSAFAFSSFNASITEDALTANANSFESNIYINRRINYLQTPIRINFQTAKPKLNLIASAGFAMNLAPRIGLSASPSASSPSRNSADLDIQNESLKYDLDGQFENQARNHYFESSFSIGLEYNLNKRWSLLLQPELRFLHLTSTSSERFSNPSQESDLFSSIRNNSQLGLFTGVRYRLR